MLNLQSALGVFAILALAFAISENRRAVPWRPVVTGLGVTFALALLMLKVPQTEIAFDWINRAVDAVADATRAGTVLRVRLCRRRRRRRSTSRRRRRNSSSASRRCRWCW